MPLGLLNFDGLLSFLDHVMEKGFLPQVTCRTIIFASIVDQLIDKLQTYVPKSDLLVSI